MDSDGMRLLGKPNKTSYFFVSLMNRENLDLCMKHAIAGFPNSTSGVWAFQEIKEHDYISFIYGARVHNLYEVERREAIDNADRLPPWKPITFKTSGRTYHFPFRLWLKPVRLFSEPLVRAEFAYVAENLLLRGGYYRTHFQADQTTLQNVSQMGSPSDGKTELLPMPNYTAFQPSFTRQRDHVLNPKVFQFSETILQAAIRQRLLNNDNLSLLLAAMSVSKLAAEDFEVLSEKALPQGHVDILIKERVPIGRAAKIPIEVKLNHGQGHDVAQVRAYMDELGNECLAGALIASSFGRAATRDARALGLALIRYTLNLDWSKPKTFEDIRNSLGLEAV